MSCEKNSLKCAGAAVRSGISQTASRFGQATGVMLERLAAAGDAGACLTGPIVSPVSSRLLKAADRPATLAASLAPYLAALAAVTAARVYTFGPGQGSPPAAGVAVALRTDPESVAHFARACRTLLLIQGVKRGSAKILGDLATLTQIPGTERRLVDDRPAGAAGLKGWNRLGRPGSKPAVEFSRSRLTPWINRQDLLVSQNRIVISEGELVRTRAFWLDLAAPVESLKQPMAAITWHRGTTVVRMPGGRGSDTDRTITHLRRLTVPSQSLYFDRALADEEVAGIVTGTGPKPRHIEGYVGTVGEMESVFAGWATIKRAMILARLHWPPAAPAWTAVQSRAEDLTLKEALSSRQRHRRVTGRAIVQELYHLIHQAGLTEKQRPAAGRAVAPNIERPQPAGGS